MVQIRQCTQPGCELRFPAPENTPTEFSCPHCGNPTRVVIPSYSTPHVQVGSNPAPGPQLEVLLDNIRSAWNVGSMLRSADGAGVRRVHLCGISPTPDNPKTFKTALGAETAVSWSYHPNSLNAANALKSQGLRLWALEGGPGVTSIFQAVRTLDSRPIALVVGNEVSGIDPELLSSCEQVVSIPMAGYKRSLNVAIAFGIAVYILRFSPCISG